MSGPDHLGLHVAARIHVLRTSQGGSVHALARASSTHHGHLRHVESGFASPNARTLAAIGGALGVSPSDLLNVDREDDLGAIYKLLRGLPEEAKRLRLKLEKRSNDSNQT